MEQELNQEIGIIKISDDVVGIISGLAANEIKGIHSMSAGFVEGITSKLSGKKNASRGVKVKFSDDNATIDIYVIVEYGLKITDACIKVQENVKKTVETMTGLKVDKINVYVQNVMFPKPENETINEEE